MKNIIQKLYRRINNSRYQFVEIGFHGDRYLLDLVDLLATKSTAFIETGTNVGSSLAYLARKHPNLPCFSCEPDKKAYQEALKNTRGLKNVGIENLPSQLFFQKLIQDRQLLTATCFFWLDAHGYGFEWPLKYEIETITSHFSRGYILIDDFKVPGKEMFLYDDYNGQECSFDFIRGSISSNVQINLYYPEYTIRTSVHHPLKGWGLLAFARDRTQELSPIQKDGISLANI